MDHLGNIYDYFMRFSLLAILIHKISRAYINTNGSRNLTAHDIIKTPPVYRPRYVILLEINRNYNISNININQEWYLMLVYWKIIVLIVNVII